jgi:hypothetical protein
VLATMAATWRLTGTQFTSPLKKGGRCEAVSVLGSCG